MRASTAPPRQSARGEYLARPPARLLPAIPNRIYLGDLKHNEAQQCEECSSSSDEQPPTPPARESTSADDEAEPTYNVDSGDRSVAAASSLRHRRNRELAAKLADVKRRAERWRLLKRSLNKPLTITVGVIVAGILVYAYVKH